MYQQSGSAIYQIDAHDKVVPLRDLPQLDPGAPLPAVIANEEYVDLVYLTVEDDPDWDGTFECFADNYESRVTTGSIASVAAALRSTWR